MPSNNIHWILELDINDGQRDNFETVMKDMVAATKADEPDAMNYEWFISSDGTQCHIYERYSDSAAVMIHLGNFGAKFADRLLATVTPTRLTVYGNPSGEVREALAGLGAAHMEQIGGFAR